MYLQHRFISRFLLPVLLSGAFTTVFSQSSFDGHLLIADSMPHKFVPGLGRTSHGTKNFARSALYLGIAEATPFVFDRYIMNKDYAKISFQSIGNNLKLSSWAWDDDGFQTNQFGHPYHGSLFFNAFRVNGYSFWQSAAATVTGSYIWETFAENQAPSPNDFINTSFGGIVLGEMTYRLANRIVNNQQTGFKKQAGEVLGFLLNPMNGLKRITSRQWGKTNPDTSYKDESEIVAELELGIRKFRTINDHIANRKTGPYGRIKLFYGNPHENYKTPFSNMYINAEFGQDDSSKVNMINVYGSLTGWQLKSTRLVHHLAILSANYDFIYNNAFFYGAQSLKLNLFSEYSLQKRSRLNTALGLGPVLLAAVPDSYGFNGRNYNYTMGLGLQAGGSLNFRDRLFLGADYRVNWLKTINGNISHYYLHVLRTELRYAITQQFSICVESGYFNLFGRYDQYKDVVREYPFSRISTRYSIRL